MLESSTPDGLAPLSATGILIFAIVVHDLGHLLFGHAIQDIIIGGNSIKVIKSTRTHA